VFNQPQQISRFRAGRIVNNFVHCAVDKVSPKPTGPQVIESSRFYFFRVNTGTVVFKLKLYAFVVYNTPGDYWSISRTAVGVFHNVCAGFVNSQSHHADIVNAETIPLANKGHNTTKPLQPFRVTGEFEL